MRLALTVFGHTLTIDTRIDCDHDDGDERDVDLITIIRDRAVCLTRGHKWDSDRPSGPLHHHDICWRCDRTRTPNH